MSLKQRSKDEVLEQKLTPQNLMQESASKFSNMEMSNFILQNRVTPINLLHYKKKLFILLIFFIMGLMNLILLMNNINL